jgi:hypothetical protein
MIAGPPGHSLRVWESPASARTPVSPAVDGLIHARETLASQSLTRLPS